VAACSYEARKFGIHSAMSSARAYRLCPQAVILPPRFNVYQSVSDEIMGIFSGYTDCVEPLSLDEAFLDVTTNKKRMALATRIAREIKSLIRSQTGLTASAGVSYNKFLAKAASDFNKPDGLTVVPPDRASDFIAALPIGKFYGVGRVTEERMNTLGIQKGGDLLAFSLEEMVRWFGKSGVFFYNIARGYDPRPVIPERERKSIGKETTLDEDTDDMGFITEVIAQLSRRVSRFMKEENLSGRTVTLKVKYHDFQTITRSLTLRDPFRDADTVTRQALVLLKDTEAGEKKIRLLGVSVSHFPGNELGVLRYVQLLLPFD
jgi:DNA polymerase IV